MVAYPYSVGTQKSEFGGLGIWGHPGLLGVLRVAWANREAI